MSQAYYHGKDKYSEWRRCDPCAIKDVPLHLYLSVLGMPGMAAYTGLLQIESIQSGETVVVSVHQVQ